MCEWEVYEYHPSGSMNLGVSRLRYVAYLFGILIALQPSYIHPDEHFQSLEVVASQVLGVKGTTPWEFEKQNAARSFISIDLFYAPVFLVFRYLLRIQSPLTILWAVRLQHCLVYLILANWALKRLPCPGSSTNRSFRMLCISTSYITWCYQSHSFSNSIETLILLIVLGLYQICLQSPRQSNYKTSFLLGFFISLGVFNRMTFPAFILFPSLKLFYSYFLHHWSSLIFLLLSFMGFSLSFILIDTQLYGSSGLVIAPWNNMRYNLDVSNLSEHGLHQWYTHILVNLPQILGPALLYIGINRKIICTRKFLTSLPFLSVMSALITLSLFQHQELRFLVPIAPLLYLMLPFNKSRILFRLWCVYNIVMGVIMGIFHQGGVIRAILNQPDSGGSVAIWWKTYSPPTWMYNNANLDVVTTNFVDGVEKVNSVDFSKTKDYVVDLKGCSVELLNYTLTAFFEQNSDMVIRLVSPSSVQTKLETIVNDSGSPFLFHEIYHSFIHLDLDHLDPKDLSTFIPGIHVWNVQFVGGDK